MIRHWGLFSVEEEQRANFRRDVFAFHVYTTSLGIALAAFGTERVLEGSNVFIGMAEIATAILMAFLSITLKLTGRLQLVRFLLSIIAGIILVVVFQEGGLGLAAPYWLFIFPHATIPYFRTRIVLALNALLYLATIVAASLGYFGWFPSLYEEVQLRQMGVALLLSMVLAFITQRNLLLQTTALGDHRARLNALLEHLPVGVIMVEADGQKPSVANMYAENVFGRPVDPAVALKDFPRAYGFMTDTGKAYAAAELPVAAALAGIDAPPRGGIFIIRPDGTKTALRAAATPIRNEQGHVVAAVAVFEDMTKENEIDRMKSEFVSLASHQLKTPLTSIQWTSELLLDDNNEPLSDTQRKSVSDIHTTTQRLSKLVTDILSVSHMETGRKFILEPQPVDLVPLLREVIAEMSDVARKRGIQITTNGLPERFLRNADMAKAKEVFLNLVGNAVKYSRPDGRIAVAVERVDGEDIVTVRDDGIGIPKEERGSIFNRFFRASNVDAETEGTGLGLYIAKTIVERHGGRIWFTSDEGAGTTFYVALPPVS